MDIVWQEPPVEALIGTNSNDKFVNALRTNPNEWALYRDKVKQRSTKMNLARKYPDIEWVSRHNDDGTYTIWARAKEQ
jgi:hypothetical protein